jgi:hypothetical protein
MEKVTKVYFDPLAATKEQVRALLQTLPVGSAHPFRPDGVLLHHSASDTITEIDISMHPEEYFSNAVNLAELGEGTLERIKLFSQLRMFSEEYMIQQAPSPTFKVPLVNDAIAIFAVSKRAPTYYDLCIADSGHKTSCYAATGTFPGLIHSGDNNSGLFLLQYIKTQTATLQETEYVLFVSGYSHTLLTKYKDENPLVLVANHQEKVLYVVPVPLDTASIGNAILCCPMVIKADKTDNSLICSILPTPTTDDSLMCSGATLPSASFAEAVERADLNLKPARDNLGVKPPEFIMSDAEPTSESTSSSGIETQPLSSKSHLIIATQIVTIPTVGHDEDTQIIRFGNGMEWMMEYETAPLDGRSTSVLPCILGGVLEGPLLLATGDAPRNSPFDRDTLLYRYYRNSTTVTVIVDQEMTDNARNLATMWRINALFIVQVTDRKTEGNLDILPLLEGLNINAVTALAGPQSLVLAQVGNRYYFYRGIANRDCFDTVGMEFGHEVTQLLEATDFGALMNARWPRLVNLSEENKVFLLKTKLEILPRELLVTFDGASLEGIQLMKEDILAAVPQLQALMVQKDLEELCARLLAIVQAKIVKATASKKEAYVKFFTHEYKSGDAELKKKKDRLLGDLRRTTKDSQSSIGWLTQTLGNVISSQNTSTKKHDLKRMIRQSAIRSNIEAVKSMTFDSLAGLLEEHAEEMGVLLVNVDADSYHQLLRNPSSAVVSAGSCCNLDSRILYLEGLDAGIVLEQSQNNHGGPLVSQLGKSQPILALPYLSEQDDTGSMLAWVCWDEFVNLENPSSVRWVEKCNEAHIAALRIMMRGTLSTAVSSRDYNMTSGGEETGQLMGSLLMASMEKLAKMRTTAPTPTIKASDTITKLMRGLFGHLLTVAGSGLKPLSFVWQLVGMSPQLDVPTSSGAWSWYENVTLLFPYTGWPATNLNQNLEKLLDKVIFRMITHSKLAVVTPYSIKQQEKASKFRNVQLSHSQTVVIALMKILTAEADSQKMAQNLLQVLPEPMESRKASYTRLYHYVEHLSKGGKRWPWGDMVAANLYTRRSAAFRELKKDLSTAIKGKDKAEVENLCQKIIEKHKGIALTWQLEPKAVKVQCLKNIYNLLDMLASHELSQIRENRGIYMCVRGDAEQWREPWQVGNGEYGTIGSLDVDALTKVLSGTAPLEVANLSSNVSVVINEIDTGEDGWKQFEKVAKPDFLKKVQQVSTPDEVCEMLKVPKSMMQVFISTLAPNFQIERLLDTFKEVVFALLKNPNQETTRPTKQLFGRLAIEGA